MYAAYDIALTNLVLTFFCDCVVSGQQGLKLAFITGIFHRTHRQQYMHSFYILYETGTSPRTGGPERPEIGDRQKH